MKFPPLRGLAAAVLTVTLVLSGPAAPAQAAQARANPDGTNTSLLEMLDFALDLLGQVGDGDISPEDLAAMTQNVINALNQAESGVIAHLDAIAVANIRDDATAAVIEFEDINNFAEETLEDWAQEVSGDAVRAAAYLDAVSAGKAVDDVGYAVVTLFPIALVARARAGFGTTNLRNQYRAALQKIADKLAPSCHYYYPEPNAVPLIRAYTCTVYGNHTATQLEQYWLGEWQLGPIDPAAVQAASYANTSRRVAVESLRLLP
ncbi:hypothetical protein GCM10022225_21530 [Plantactinospora mayteni]|uniref:Uncharacterized protein n=1 Tax=Plantactinospora mayteni TaxID=566021 RepID=A0ABQ4ENW8_9ACTN|nr:hypothetical protein [Plantactinospora mayteni]GIG96334.1 hypothetical protein Pma05_29070 [Plantactinospora mayteni]